MGPASAPVLGAAAVVASPALWSSLVEQTMPLEVGLTRYLVAVGLCWVLVGVVGEMIFPRPTPPRTEHEEPAAANASAAENLTSS